MDTQPIADIMERSMNKLIKLSDDSILIKRLKSLADVDLKWGDTQDLGYPLALIMFDNFQVSVRYAWAIKTEDASFSHLFGVEKEVDSWIDVETYEYKLFQFEDSDGAIPNAVIRLLENKNNKKAAEQELKTIIHAALEDVVG